MMLRPNIARGSALLLCLTCLVGQAFGGEYLSNLLNPFVDPANPGASASEIGDIEPLVYPYDPIRQETWGQLMRLSCGAPQELVTC